MSKLSKLIEQPAQSIHDSLLKRLPLPQIIKENISDKFIDYKLLKPKLTNKPIIFVVGFGTWKQYLHDYFKDYELIFLSPKISRQHFTKKYRWQILATRKSCQVLIWGFKAPEFLINFLRNNEILTFYTEDGFIRSVGLGASKVPPLSLCMDSIAPYFDASQPTNIEELLNNFDCDNSLIQRAEKLIDSIHKHQISKYNHIESIDVISIYGKKTTKRILVIGQVEDDASILYGCNQEINNNDLVKLAVDENPDAQVIYKVHPDVLNGHRDYRSSPDAVRNICQVLEDDVPLADALKTIDHVYTITSLSGLEALVKGISVTTVGCPFYSGWGLTDDRQVNHRRSRKRTLAELVAISYIVYPKYFDAYTGVQVEVEDLIQHICNIKTMKGDTINRNQHSHYLQQTKKEFFLKKSRSNEMMDMNNDANTTDINHKLYVPKGIYRHHKGKLYQVLHTAHHSETNEILVVYQMLYGDYSIWIRPLKIFIEKIIINGKDGRQLQSRFELVKEL